MEKSISLRKKMQSSRMNGYVAYRHRLINLRIALKLRTLNYKMIDQNRVTFNVRAPSILNQMKTNQITLPRPTTRRWKSL